MFKRCVFYFMIGMNGLAFVMISELLFSGQSSFYTGLGLIGFGTFILFSIIFFVEIVVYIVKQIKKENKI